jgi:GTP-binding protein EngB required for normal cell division
MDESYIVFTGRPNAGKSSIIKQVFGINVRTGKYPGTTRRINSYLLSQGLYLVDMPGFGRMHGISRRFENNINQKTIDFLESNAQYILLAIHVLDISTFSEVTRRLEKKKIKSLDIEMVQFLEEILGFLPFIAANKIDKEEEVRIKAELEEFIDRLSMGHSSKFAGNVFPVSAKTGAGLKDLKKAIHEWLVKKGHHVAFRI